MNSRALASEKRSNDKIETENKTGDSYVTGLKKHTKSHAAITVIASDGVADAIAVPIL